MYIQEKITWEGDVEQKLSLLKTLGVDCISVELHLKPPTKSGIDFSTSESATRFMKMAKDTVKKHGMELRTMLATSGLDEIKRGTAGRDQQIALLRNALQGMGAAGIPILAYNFKMLRSELLRSAPTQGRGAATYISFDYDEYLKKPAPAISPPLSEEQMLSNLGYFLTAVIPTAEKLGVRMALHPDDPPVPHGTPALAGAAHIVSNLDDYHRIFRIIESPSNGMLFCQGCVTEMKDVDVYDAIRHMGSINKIVMVHFRNVRGSFPKFQESFVDEGDVDTFRAMQAYRDVGFKGPFSLDHSPKFPGSQVANQAFMIGYMRALIQAVYR